MQPDVGLLHMNSLTLAFSLDWKYCSKKNPNLSLECSSFSVSRALNLFSHQLQVKSKLFSCSQSNSLAAATHLRAFVIFLILGCLRHTFLPTITGLRPLPLLSLLGDAVYLLFTSWAQQSLLTSSWASSTWHCIICIRAHILDGRPPVLFLAPPQGETPGTLCIWRHGQDTQTQEEDFVLLLNTLFLMYWSDTHWVKKTKKTLVWPDNTMKMILKLY